MTTSEIPSVSTFMEDELTSETIKINKERKGLVDTLKHLVGSVYPIKPATTSNFVLDEGSLDSLIVRYSELCERILNLERRQEAKSIKKDEIQTKIREHQSTRSPPSTVHDLIILYVYMVVQIDRDKVDIIESMLAFSTNVTATLVKSFGQLVLGEIVHRFFLVLPERLWVMEIYRDCLIQDIQSGRYRVRRSLLSMENIISFHNLVIQFNRQEVKLLEGMNVPVSASKFVIPDETTATSNDKVIITQSQFEIFLREEFMLEEAEFVLIKNLDPYRLGARGERLAPILGVVKGLKKVWIKDGNEQEVCAVCIQEMKVGDDARVTDYCSHRFHFTCIFEWMKRKPNCPLCRHLMPVNVFKRRKLLND